MVYGPFKIYSVFVPLDHGEETSTVVLDSSSTGTHYHDHCTTSMAEGASDHATTASNNEVSKTRSTNVENAEVTTEQLTQVTTEVTTATDSSSLSPYSSVETEKHSTEQPDHAVGTTFSAEESEDIDTEQTTVDHTIAMGQEDVSTTSTRHSTSVETEAVSTGQIRQQPTTVSNEEITTSMAQVYTVKSTDALTSRSTYGATSGETTIIHSTTEFRLNESEITGPRTPDEVSPGTRVKSTQIPELNLTETNLDPSTIKTAVTYNESAANIASDHTLLPDKRSFVSGITTSDLQSEVNIATSSPWDGLLSTSGSYGTATPVYRLEWDSWLPWSGCSLTCGGGTRYRFKICKPAPDNMTSYMSSECNQELGHGFCEFTIYIFAALF